MTSTTTTMAAVTIPAPVEPAPLKRVAILGTAQSWRWCPWEDETLEVWGLNDGYMLKVPRATRWYDLHPFHQMLFRGPQDKPHNTVPVGAYARPAGHLEWLRSRPFPVFLRERLPDYPTSQRFPLEEVLAWWQRYWPWRLDRQGRLHEGPDYEVSTPAWMFMQAVVEGYREIHTYGVHLASEWEYVYQRPNYEFLLGVASGLGIRLVLPSTTPICRTSSRYAFAPKADLPVQEMQQRIGQIKQEGLRLRQRLGALRSLGSRSERADLMERLGRLDIELADSKQQLHRLHVMELQT